MLCASEVLSNKQWADQVVAWYDELAMLQIVCRGDITHDDGAYDADNLEAVISASGGNVSRFLMPEERTWPDGASPAIRGLEVSFSLDLSEECTIASELGLHVSFAHGYPLHGGVPEFELLPSKALAPSQTAHVIGAAEAAAKAALAEGDSNVVYCAVRAAREALAEPLSDDQQPAGSSGGEGDGGGDSTVGDADGDSGDADSSTVGVPLAEQTSGGAWAVLGGCGKALHEVLSAWDTQRSFSASKLDFIRAAQALGAVGICSRTPTTAELDAMYEGLCEGRARLPLARLLEPIDVVAGLIEKRLRGIECRTWDEIDKWADETYNWSASQRLDPAPSPELQRDPTPPQLPARPM
jgi:hypothetical protein